MLKTNKLENIQRSIDSNFQVCYLKLVDNSNKSKKTKEGGNEYDNAYNELRQQKKKQHI